MNDEEICQELDRACQHLPFTLYFQVSQQPPYLYIFINRPVESSPDHGHITALLGETIADLELEHITHLALYSRPLGEAEHDWALCVPLSDFIQETLLVSLHEGVSETTIRQPIVIPRLEDPTLELGDTMEENTELVNYLADQPFSDVEEEDTVLRSGRTPAGTQSLEEPEVPMREIALNQADFSQYCFVNNPAELSVPSQEIPSAVAKSLTVFHRFPTRGKHRVLPLLRQIFQGDRTIVFIHFPNQVQRWFEYILTLTDEEIKISKVWFSRYCQNAPETLREMQRLLQTAAVDSPSEASARQNQPLQSPALSIDARPRGTSAIPAPSPGATGSISISAPAQGTASQTPLSPRHFWIWLGLMGIGSFCVGGVTALFYPEGIHWEGWIFLLIALLLQAFSTATANMALQRLQGGIFTAAAILGAVLSRDGLVGGYIAGGIMGFGVGHLLRLQFLNTQKRLPQNLSGLWELLSDRTGTIALTTALVCFTLPMLFL